MLEAWKKNSGMRELSAFMEDDSGVGVIEVVLILVVLIGLVIIFKTQITKLLENIFKEIESQSKEVY
ncbi:Flp1 family type IVb pilin [Ventrimonas sp. CLA-AP-H27]|uniref:Flp1 family type IVb pilin n=1 Tax=Ventrimonas faecis TaxID=3133170 RepID=A0ABV1HN92_9FIRM